MDRSFFYQHIIKGMLTPKVAHMPPFTSVTASGHVKRSGSDPPAKAGRILTFNHGYFGDLFILFRITRLPEMHTHF